MREVIYLVVSRNKVERMTKKLPDVYRGETVVKLDVTVDPKAFQPPTLDQHVVVNDWRDNIDLEDVQFNGNIITEEEAQIIRERRIAKMAEILKEQGYSVTKDESDED